MAANITFTDGTGAATLTVPTANGRFNNWTPDPLPVDDSATRLGNGQVDSWVFRYPGKFTIEILLLNTDMSIAIRLMNYLWTGGTCVVNTADLTVSPLSYSDMGIGTDDDGNRIRPALVLHNRDNVDYSLTMSFQYVGASTVPLPVVKY